MSPTTTTGSSAAVARPMFAMSSSRRLISVGEPAPSHTTTSNRERRSARQPSTVSSSPAFIGRYDSAVTSATGRPRTTTWLEFSPPGLSSTGFIAASGSTNAAAACITWARPISAPSAVTIELLLMFCALNGATDTPWRASQRQMPAVTTDLPASDVVPATSSAPLTAGSCRATGLVPPGLLLAGERGDRQHDAVGDHPAGEALAGLAALLGEGERLPEGDRDAVRPGPARADGLHLVGAGHGHRDDGAVGGQREPRHPGLPAGQPAVAGAGPLGVDPERAAVLEHRERGVERGLRGARGLALHRQGGQPGEQHARQPAAHAGAGEVLGLGEVGDLARRHERDRDAVDERQVVAGQDDRAGQWHVLPAGDVRAEDQPEQRPQHEARENVEHASAPSWVSGPRRWNRPGILADGGGAPDTGRSAGRSAGGSPLARPGRRAGILEDATDVGGQRAVAGRRLGDRDGDLADLPVRV